MHTGHQLLLSSSANTCQERGRVFERLTQHATHRHSDVYGPARFKNVWRWVDGHGRIGRRTDTAVMQESTSFVLSYRPRRFWSHEKRLPCNAHCADDGGSGVAAILGWGDAEPVVVVEVHDEGG